MLKSLGNSNKTTSVWLPITTALSAKKWRTQTGTPGNVTSAIHAQTHSATSSIK